MACDLEKDFVPSPLTMPSFLVHKTLSFDLDYEERSDALSGPHWKADGSSISSDLACPATCRLPAKALNIIWGNDPRFWQWFKLSEEETRSIGFDEGTMLLQANRVEVSGKLSTTLFNVAFREYNFNGCCITE
ncbi:unnamed protein product [Dovyalis caffra]|uniref:Uncharacterized protein n=1 Tax=Dovyalis caffra TaxID=77055 RepID=A0AAV1RP05_9ROSI|nr:unnamed protein product [Dovyalis caffra]